MDNRTHIDQPQTRRLPFSERFAPQRELETDDEVSRMENEGGPPPVRKPETRLPNGGTGRMWTSSRRARS